MVLTPSRRQLRHREVGWEGSRSAKPCTDEQKSRRRHVEMDKSARKGKVRHHQQSRRVDVAAVGRRLLFLSGEICLGVVRQHDKHQRKAMRALAEVSRRRITDRGRQPRQEGLNSKCMAI